MSSAKIELVRSYLEEIENTKKAIVQILHDKTSNPKHSVIADHKIKSLVESVQNKSMDAYLLLQDKSG
jgi:hypothetical protein